MKKYIKLLQGIGVDELSSQIYLCLLENGELSITHISKYTSLHRTQIYRLIPYLLEIGLVIELYQGKRKVYKPAHPEKINREYQKMISDNTKSIHELTHKFDSLEKNTNISFYKGLTGIKKVYHDIVDTLGQGGIFYRITSELDSKYIKSYYQPKDYISLRDKKEIERYVILSDKAFKDKQPKLERDVRVIKNSVDSFDDNISFTIYDDKMSFVDFNSETSIIIESPQIARFQKKIFQLLFKKLDK
ncbi:hypothetical protein MK079_05255 [Candidatus Gracilibacteria bacterium]|nr:hypothetical protein [Candidatus Gracilibacteria bacterium]